MSPVLRTITRRIATLPALRRIAALGPGVLLALGLAACDDATGPGSTNTVSFSVAVPQTFSGSSAALAPALDVQQTDGSGNELVIQRVQIALEEIELEREVEECPDDTTAEDECEELEKGPFLVDLNPPEQNQIQQDLVVKQIPEQFVGVTFDELEFEVDGRDDATFVNVDRPDFPSDRSIQVDGTYNGTDFTFTSTMNAEQELPISLTIDPENPATNVTLSIDLTSWFRADDGSLIDPNQAQQDGSLRSDVENNIQDSFEAFEDEDEDGLGEDVDDDEDPEGDDGDDDEAES